MHDTGSVVAIVEHAREVRPFCPCGHHTIPVLRAGVVWLDCRLVNASANGVVRRLLTMVLGHAHHRIATIEPIGRSAVGVGLLEAA